MAAPKNISFQSRIYKPDGTPLEAAGVQFKFSLMNPLSTCVIYSETFSSIDLSSTAGNVVLSLGAGSRSYPATGTMAWYDAFNNATTNYTCQTTGTYAPTTLDNRRLIMQFNDGSGTGWQTMPAMEINSVPFAMFAENSEKFQGRPVTDFVLGSALPTCAATDVLTFNGTNFSCVTPATNFAPSAITAGGASTGQVLKWNGANWAASTDNTNVGTVTSVSSANSYLTVANGTSTPALTLNVGAVTNTVAAGNDPRIVGGFQTATTLSGDLTGTLPNPIIANSAVNDAKISDVAFSKVTGRPTTLAGYGITDGANSSLNAGQIYVGNASNLAQNRVLSGDATMNANGILLINNGAITNSKILSVDWSKITATPTSVAGYNITDALTTATILSGDVSGVYNGLTLSSVNASGAGTYSKVTVDAKGRVLSATQIGSTDVTTALGYTPSSNALTSANIFVGNASNIAQGQVLSGDATVNNSGILALSNVGAGGSFPKVTYDTKGRVLSGSALNSADVTTGLGYTPSSNALNSGLVFVGNASNVAQGVSFSGDIASLSSAGIVTFSNVGAGGTFPKVTYDTKGRVLSGSPLASSDVTTGLGYTPSSNALNAGLFFVGNASNVAAGISLSGDIASVTSAGIVTFSNVGAGGTFPKVTYNTKGLVTSGSALNSGDVTTGLGYTPSSNVLTSANIFVGNASNVAQGQVLSGDATINNSGILAFNTVSAGGTYPKVTYDTKGRVLSGSALASSDVTTGLGYTPSSNILTSANIFVGNASNVAEGRVLSGDATINNSGILTINNNAITNVKISDVAFSKLTSKPTTLSGYGITDAFSSGGGSINGSTTFTAGYGTVNTTGNQFTVGAGGGSFNAASMSFGDNTGWKMNFGTNVAGTFTPRVTMLDTGNVGIGTTTPGQKLTVVGTIESTSGGIKFPDGTTQTTASASAASVSGTTNYLSKFSSSSAIGNSQIFDNGAYVGIGTTTPSTNLVIGGARPITFDTNIAKVRLQGDVGGWAMGYGFKGSAGTDYEGFGAFGAADGLTRYYIGKYSVDEKVSVLANGDVGIGTTTPTYKLDVAGDVNVSGNFKINGVNISAGSVTSVTATGPVVSSGGAAPVISMAQATGTVPGYLAAADWTIFNNKLSTSAVAGATNYVPKFSSANVIGNSSITDDGTTVTTSGQLDVTGGTGLDYTTAPIEIRNAAARISFHRPGVVASQIGVDAAGVIRTYNNPGTGYENFAANNITSNGVFTGSGAGLTGTASGLTAGSASAVAWSAVTGKPNAWLDAITLTGDRPDAGAAGAGVTSGFYQTSAPAPAADWYPGASSWQHLIDTRHSNTGNNYSMQVAGSFFDQEFWARKTNNAANTAWRQMIFRDSASAGTANTITKFTGTGQIGHSIITDDGATATIGGALATTGAVTIGTNVNFTMANPTLTASSYLTIPGGAYFSGGTVYITNAIQARGGIANDSATYLTLGGGTSGNTYVSGNLGVGTTAPDAAFEVKKTSVDATLLQEVARFSTDGRTAGTGTANRGSLISFKDGANATLTAAVGGIRQAPSGDYNGGLAFYTNATGGAPATLVSELSERMRIKSDGSVGIGTANPGYKLDVAGDIKLSGTGLRNSAGYRMLEGNATDWLRINPDASYASGTAAYSNWAFGSGGVAIGTWTNPGAGNLTVSGTATAAQFVGGGAGITGVSASSVPWSGVTGAPTTLAGYGITDNVVKSGTAGDWNIASSTNNSSYPYAAFEIREFNFGGAQTGANSEAPRIGFHWSGRVASQIGMDTGGTIRTFDNPGTGYAPFAAAGVTANGALVSTGATTVGTDLNFTAANPNLTASSYLVIPNGAFFSGGTVYTQNAIQARGGVHNDSAAYLTISGGTSGDTYVSGNNLGVGTASPAAKVTVSGAGQNTASFNTAGAQGASLILDDTVNAAGNGGALVFSAASQVYKFAAIKGLATSGAGNSQGDVVISTRRIASDATLTEAVRVVSDGTMAMNGGKITGVGTPTAASDVATKAYVDSNSSTGGSFSKRVIYISSTTWTVPAGITTIMTDVWGAGGGEGGYGNGGNGGTGGTGGSSSIVGFVTVNGGAGGSGSNYQYCNTRGYGGSGGAACATTNDYECSSGTQGRYQSVDGACGSTYVGSGASASSESPWGVTIPGPQNVGGTNAGGGGSGAYARGVFTVTPGQVLTITVGAGGTGGAAGVGGGVGADGVAGKIIIWY